MEYDELQLFYEIISQNIALEIDRSIFDNLNYTFLIERWRCSPDTEQNPGDK